MLRSKVLRIFLAIIILIENGTSILTSADYLYKMQSQYTKEDTNEINFIHNIYIPNVNDRKVQ